MFTLHRFQNVPSLTVKGNFVWIIKIVHYKKILVEIDRLETKTYQVT